LARLLPGAQYFLDRVTVAFAYDTENRCFSSTLGAVALAIWERRALGPVSV